MAAKKRKKVPAPCTLITGFPKLLSRGLAVKALESDSTRRVALLVGTKDEAEARTFLELRSKV